MNWNTLIGVALIAAAIFMQQGGEIPVLGPPVGTESYVAAMKSGSVPETGAKEMGPLLIEISQWIAKNPNIGEAELKDFCNEVNDNLDKLARNDGGLDGATKTFIVNSTQNLDYSNKQTVVNTFHTLGKAMAWYGGATIQDEAKARISTFVRAMQ